MSLPKVILENGPVLDTFSLDGVTVATLFDTRRLNRDRLYPVRYRVTFMRKQVYYSSGIALTVKEWDRLPNARNQELRNNKVLIQKGFSKIKNHLYEFSSVSKFVSILAFRL